MSLEIIILAAGQGTRMKSSLPKVLHPLAGRPLLQHVLDTALALKPVKIHVVIGHGGEQVKRVFASSDYTINWVEQSEQKGTGHAVQQVIPDLASGSDVLILYGDVPLTAIDTLSALLTKLNDQSIALLTFKASDPTGLGRIVRDEQMKVMAIVEHKDASAEQLLINEANSGILAVNAGQLSKWVKQLDDGNAQGEYYLTDIIAMAVAEDKTVNTLSAPYEYQVAGVNSRTQLAALERQYQRACAKALMEQGVHVIDPDRIDIRTDLKNIDIGTDTEIDINVILQGRITIGYGCKIGAHSILIDCELADQVEIAPYSHLQQAVVDKKASVGPYARLRPGARLGKESKVGNFVEVKKSTLGDFTKASHLSYVGDAIIGDNVNIGAGTITCNYDGVNKAQTIIHSDSFIGSNTALVAPVTVGKSATIGAGSTITKDVSDNALAVSRAKQSNIKGWQRPTKKES